MKPYQMQSILLVLCIYLVAFIPTWILLFQKSNFENKQKTIYKICALMIVEIIIFSLIYIFSNQIVHFMTAKTNLQNYTLYCLKILFMASAITVIHYYIPYYFYLHGQTKKGIFLILFKLGYIPFMFIGNLFFQKKGIFFAVPICDLLYTFILLYIFRKDKSS